MAFSSRKNGSHERENTPDTEKTGAVPLSLSTELGAEELLLGLGPVEDVSLHAPADASGEVSVPGEVLHDIPLPPTALHAVPEIVSPPAEPLPVVEKLKDKGPSIFRNRNFMLLWIAQGLSQTAQYALNITLLQFVSDLTNGSTFYTGTITTALLLPGVFFSALAGVLVDRYEKRKVLIISNVARAITVLPLILINQNFPLAIALPLIFVLTALFSTISQFFSPAEGSMIPLVVSRKQYVIANSLFNITLGAAVLVGFAIIGPTLRAVIGDRNLFISIAITYALCTLLVWWLPSNLEPEIEVSPRKNVREYVSDIWPELLEGWNFIRRDNLISVSIIYMSMVMAVLFTVATIGSKFVVEGLGLPSNALALVMAPAGLGLVIGIVLINRWSNTFKPDVLIICATFAMGAAIIVMSLIKPLGDNIMRLFGWAPNSYSGVPLIIPIVVVAVILGLGMAFVNIPGQTVLQDRSPEDVRGRVFAAYFTFSNLISIFPTLIAGALSDILGVVPVLCLVGVVVSLMAGIGVLRMRSRTRRLRHLPDPK